MKEEVWKDIPGISNTYQVSSFGSLRKLSGTGYEIILNHECPSSNFSTNKGYLRISIEGKTYFVHRLVASAFLPKPDAEKDQVNHKDNIKTNNNIDNLEWVSAKQNREHYKKWHKQYSPSLWNKTRQNLSVEQIAEIRSLAFSGENTRNIAISYGISETLVDWVLEDPSESCEEIHAKINAPFYRDGSEISLQEIMSEIDEREFQVNLQCFSTEHVLDYYNNLTNEYSWPELFREAARLCPHTVFGFSSRELDYVPPWISDELLEYSLKGLESIRV